MERRVVVNALFIVHVEFFCIDRKCHASRRLPDVILRCSFTRPSTALAVIEGLGTRLYHRIVLNGYVSPCCAWGEDEDRTVSVYQ